MLAALEPALGWNDIVRTHSSLVYRMAFRLTGNQHDAEDLTQEVFLKVFRALPTYKPGTFEGWLRRITTNQFLDWVRRSRRIRLQPLGDLADLTPDLEQVWEERLFDPDIQTALDSLTPAHRAAVVLCDIEGLPYKEAADLLGAKKGTIASRLHRGRAQLRTHLEHRRKDHVHL